MSGSQNLVDIGLIIGSWGEEVLDILHCSREIGDLLEVILLYNENVFQSNSSHFHILCDLLFVQEVFNLLIFIRSIQ